MKKERTRNKDTYISPLDGLVAVTKQLSVYEQQYQMSSEQFVTRYGLGELDDRVDFVEWNNAYQHYVGVHQQIGKCQ